MGNSRALALPRNAAFCASLISPINSILRLRSSSGAISLSQYPRSTLSIFAAIFSGFPDRAAMRIALSGRF
jgi:hypothetical protein